MSLCYKVLSPPKLLFLLQGKPRNINIDPSCNGVLANKLAQNWYPKNLSVLTFSLTLPVNNKTLQAYFHSLFLFLATEFEVATWSKANVLCISKETVYHK